MYEDWFDEKFYAGSEDHEKGPLEGKGRMIDLCCADCWWIYEKP